MQPAWMQKRKKKSNNSANLIGLNEKKEENKSIKLEVDIQKNLKVNKQ